MSLPDAASLEAFSIAELRDVVGHLVGEVRRLHSDNAALQVGADAQQTTISALRAENQALRDEGARLKELPPRPPSRPSGMEQATRPGAADQGTTRSKLPRGFRQGSRQSTWLPGLIWLQGRSYAARWAGMQCVVCGSKAVTERPERTAQGYRRFRCRQCGKQFNERSGTVLNRAQYPSDVIALVVLWRLRYKLSLRDLPEMFALRGIVFSYETVREWEAKLTPALAEELRRRRRGKAGRSWYVDETYLKVDGCWCYLYRAIDRSGALVDVLFSEHRDMAAARAFFRSAKAVTGITPDRVTTDGHDSYPRAIRTELGKRARHRTSRYLNNKLEMA